MNCQSLPSSLQSRNGWSSLLEARRPSQPHVHQIEPTNHCPYSCIMCPRSEKMDRALGFMDMELYGKIIDEIARFDEPVRSREIELFHFGESLLHPEIDKMIGYASDHKLNVVLSVNAPQLTPTMAEKILANNPARIIISLDGHDEQSYQAIRGKAANYSKAVSNIEHLIETLREEPRETDICLRIIRLNANEENLDRSCREWQEKGLAVEVRPFFPWSEKGMVELGEVEKYPPGMPCPFPWQYLVVQWDGTVVPCCRDYNGVNAQGNVKQQNLQEIWDGEAYRHFREQHQTGRYGKNLFCQNCMDIFYTPAPAEEARTITLCEDCSQSRNHQYILDAGWQIDYHLGELSNGLDPDNGKTFQLSRGQAAVLSLAERLCCKALLAERTRLSSKEIDNILFPLLQEGAVNAVRQEIPCGSPTTLAEEETFAALWQTCQADYGGRPLLLADEDGSLFAYDDADEVVRMVAAQLLRAGVEKGDRILVRASQHIEAVFLCWASLLLGAVFVPIDPQLPDSLWKEILGETTPKLIFGDMSLIDGQAGTNRLSTVILDDPDDLPLPNGFIRFSDWLEQDAQNPPPFQEQAPDEPAVILYTSGTSGCAKGVLLSQAALYRSGRLMAQSYRWQPEDVLFSLGDLHTISGLRNPCLAPLHTGSSVVIASRETRSNALVIADCVERHRITQLATVPATLRQFNRFGCRIEKSSLASLRQILCTGSILTPEVKKQFEDSYRISVHNYYGLTETAGFCIGNLPGDPPEDPASIGKPLGCLARIEDESGRSLQPGEVGNLVLYPENRMDGYFREPDLSAKTLESGWYITGDLAMRCADGGIVLVGRSSDIIKNIRGEIVHPDEIERGLENHPEIAEAGVCGYLSGDGDEKLAAFLVPNNEVADAEHWIRELRADSCQLLGPSRLPHLFRAVASLPRTSNGKLLRRELKKRLSEEETQTDGA